MPNNDGWLIPADWPMSASLAKSALHARHSGLSATMCSSVVAHLRMALAYEGIDATTDDLLALLDAASTRSSGPVPVDDTATN